jgi:predicted dehydrogenase
MGSALRIGIIGAGWAGKGHAFAYARLPDVVVAGVWSRTQDTAKALIDQLGQPGPKVHASWEDMVDSNDIDVVSIAAPPTLRLGPVAAALARDLPVLIEKPFTVHLNEAQEIARLVGKSKAVTAISFNWRYSPGNQVAWRAVDDGAIGQVTGMSLTARVRFPGQMDAATVREWTKSTNTGGGAIRQFGSHEIDRVRYLTGQDVVSVTGRLPKAPVPGMDVDGQYNLLVDLSAGGTAHVASTMTPGEGEWRAILFGEEGTLRLTHEEVVLQRRADDEPVALPVPEADRVPDGVDLLQHTWNRLIADFCTAVREGDVAHESVPHLPTVQDGLQVQAFIGAAEQAEKERRWVDLA